MNKASAFFFPNRMGRIILESMEEVVGRNGLNAVLNLAGLGGMIGNYPPSDKKPKFSFEIVSGLMEKLEQAYGPRGGHGLAVRIGRTSFKYGMREFGPQMGLNETAFRFLPFSTKLRIGGQSLADMFNKETDQRIRIEKRDGKLLWHIERCPLCWGRHTNDTVCHLAVGLLQESLYWVSGGKIFKVEETLCLARGDPTCTIEIDQTPLD
jgi:predicted hydrocarbon binding protein